ncbi:MAG TPA: thiamine pyrophosphate-binding protein [Candidatus Limnocylindria bacterium]|nr:thiamine pyrophosphate-binding protein [Candidatus Limnocylindria bacterium]
MDSTRSIGEAMSRPLADDGDVDGGAIVARVLREHGVDVCFALNGVHIWPILRHLRDNGIRMIHMRHEQSCAYAADAYARSARRPGVLAVTAGCGLTNAVTGLCVAHHAGSAVVCLAGQHPTTEDGIGSFQEAYGTEICGSFTKFAKRVLDWTTIRRDVRAAFRAASAWPVGPALVELPTNVLYHQGAPARQRAGAQPFDPDAMRGLADPAAVERAADRLLAAERPLLAAGDGVFWSDAAAEVRLLAERLSMPVYSRRAGQGALPETHPLAVRGSWKKPFTGRADVVLAVGFRFWSGEHFGEPPTWAGDAAYLHVDPQPLRIGAHVDAEVALVGDPRLVLRQLLTALDARGGAPRRHDAWLDELRRVRERFDEARRTQEAAVHDATPIHPARLVRELVDVLPDDVTLVVDSFTLSGWLSDWFAARFPGQVIDAGPLAPVGHGIGMGIGAQLARPGKPVVVVIGDGGLGIGGMEIETALRYRLPVVTLVWNNSSWGPSFDQMPMLRGHVDPFDMLPDLRYDRMFEAIGCHAEHVAQPGEIRGALERALGAGKAAMVNVLGDARVGHPRLGGNLLGSTKV